MTGGDSARQPPITRNEGVPGSSPGVGFLGKRARFAAREPAGSFSPLQPPGRRGVTTAGLPLVSAAAGSLVTPWARQGAPKPAPPSSLDVPLDRHDLNWSPGVMGERHEHGRPRMSVPTGQTLRRLRRPLPCPVPLDVMDGAEPADPEGLGVVVVTALTVRVAADFAWLCFRVRLPSNLASARSAGLALPTARIRANAGERGPRRHGSIRPPDSEARSGPRGIPVAQSQSVGPRDAFHFLIARQPPTSLDLREGRASPSRRERHLRDRPVELGPPPR